MEIYFAWSMRFVRLDAWLLFDWWSMRSRIHVHVLSFNLWEFCSSWFMLCYCSSRFGEEDDAETLHHALIRVENRCHWFVLGFRSYWMNGAHMLAFWLASAPFKWNGALWFGARSTNFKLISYYSYYFIYILHFISIIILHFWKIIINPRMFQIIWEF